VTALKLVNYPEAPAPRGTRLVLDGASHYSVSRDGRTYTFTIRRGLRFSDGQPVTAANFAYAFNRAANKNLLSPAFGFIGDPKGANILGAEAVRAGRAASMWGIRVRGNKLVVTLAKPDGAFLSRLTMPFFQALPLHLPRNEKVTDVNRATRLPSAGPYYVFERDPNRVVVLKRNPYYRGPRLRRVAEIRLNVAQNLDELQASEDERSRPHARASAWGCGGARA
jgi:ABC-type transport system substrate-binding protein